MTPLAPGPSRIPRSRDDRDRAGVSCATPPEAETPEFQVRECDGRIEGRRLDVDPDVLGSLIRGEWLISDTLDLHRLTIVDARQAVARFLGESTRKGRRAVLIVTGRGRHSPARHAVLRGEIAEWLTTDRSRASVLCFATARPEDGGLGAIYVLLRRVRT